MTRQSHPFALSLSKGTLPQANRLWLAGLRQAQPERLLGALIVATIAVVPAHAQRNSRTNVTPYIAVGQILTADLDGSDVLTYSTVSAGIDASVHTRRVEVQLSYNYERRFDYQKKLASDQVHSGIARAKVVAMPGVTMEAGAIATRARSDVRGDAPTNLVGNVRNTSQVYSAYAGPSVATHVGPIFANAAYRFGITKVEAPDIPSPTPGQPALDVFDRSTVHVASASVGVKSGHVLPVGITASGSWTKENATQLDQKFDGKFGRGDVVLPIGRGLAIGAGVGYEQIKITQRDPLMSGGVPVVDGAGRQVTDPASAPRIAYNFDGIFWDAGVIWRPSPRTFFEARVGKRYGSMSYTGSFSYQYGRNSAVQVGVYDNVTSFGRQVNGAIAALPTSFVTGADAIGGNYTGCAFGTAGGSAGSCNNAVFASIPTSNYRARGVTGVVSMGSDGSRIGAGLGYSRRTFLTPTGGPSNVVVNGSDDETIFGQVFASHKVGPRGSLGGNAFASYYRTDLAGADPVIGWGANTIYSHQFGGLSASAALGVFGFEGQDDVRDVSAQAMVGLRYGF